MAVERLVSRVVAAGFPTPQFTATQKYSAVSKVVTASAGDAAHFGARKSSRAVARITLSDSWRPQNGLRPGERSPSGLRLHPSPKLLRHALPEIHWTQPRDDGRQEARDGLAGCRSDRSLETNGSVRSNSAGGQSSRQSGGLTTQGTLTTTLKARLWGSVAIALIRFR